MANEIIFQAGGRLSLSLPWTAQPSAATFTLRTLQNQPVSVIGGGFTDLEHVHCNVSNLVLTLPACNEGAKIVIPTLTTGAIPNNITDIPLLFNRGGRRQMITPLECDHNGTAVSKLRFDVGLPFALVAGDTASALEVSYNLDLSGVSSAFTGKLQGIWDVTVNGETHRTTMVYDIVKQKLAQPATWQDVVNLRPDVADHLRNVANKEEFVRLAWENVQLDLYALGIRHNLIVADGSATLRDAVVFQTIYNLTIHLNLPVPSVFEVSGEAYLDRIMRDKDKCLGQLSFPIDHLQIGILDSSNSGRNRKAVYFRQTSRSSN
jgi:hypothetical protein